MARRPQHGFTLIELMITVAIVALLAAVAYPSYTSHVKKSNRRAAQAQMLDIANRQQQFFLANRQYATTLGDLSYSLPSEVGARYGAAIAANNGASPPNFMITFTPSGAQASDGNLTLNSVGAKTPAEKW